MREVALEVELWGPKYTEMAKQALSAIEKYKGPTNEEKDDELYISISNVYEKYLDYCAKEAAGGFACWLKSSQTDLYKDRWIPLVALVLSEVAPEPHKSLLYEANVTE